ncbi:MAG: type 4a pilus biogenesis protein PilO [Desulfobacterota bacterium]|nr:type 4a pilus biogenesis protein PilO [Thermodesulfobacteriota bacterium]MDW8002161.1 type 4a pilus biogenesis protein PilO [Deltaproteobacteria bacterium]
MKKLEKVPRLIRILVIFFVNLIIVFGIFSLVVKPKIEKEVRLKSELQELERKLSQLIGIANRFDEIKREHTELRKAFEDVIRELPESKDIPNLLRTVSNIGAESKVKLTKLEPKAMEQKDFYAEFPFEIRFSGPYHNIGYFFDGIRREKRIIHVVNFSLEAKTPASQALMLEGLCTAKTYVYTGEKPKEQKKSETSQRR